MLQTNVFFIPKIFYSHFESKVNFGEHCLTDLKDIDLILDTYWERNKNKIQLKWSNGSSIESYKIKICLACDATSLTTFLKVNHDYENYMKEESCGILSDFEIKQLKYLIFKDIIDGNFSIDLSPKVKQYLEAYERSVANHKTHFFSFLIQHLD